MTFHPFHMVTPSPWPVTSSFSVFVLMVSTLSFLHLKTFIFSIFSLLLILINFFVWWRDVVRESTMLGQHTLIVKKGLKLGMILFIVSEVLFFTSFFWAFFHSSLSPDLNIGLLWPPKDVNPFNPYHVPLLNTIILLSSGFSITWSHHSMLNKNLYSAFSGISLTILLGCYFSSLQGFEYSQANFSINDSIYGTSFFLTTGFHGMHVLIGTIFLIITSARMFFFQFNSSNHFGFEAAAWYWHFVDVVWLFLFTFIYWWVF